MESPISKSVVFAYLSGQATPIEIQSVDDWLKKPGSYEVFCFMLLEWEREHAQFTPDREKAIANFWERVESPSELTATSYGSVPAKAQQGITRIARRLLTIAACMTLLVAAGWLFSDKLLYKTIHTAYGEISRQVLPDGSEVTLNANSSLRFPRLGFGKDTREVWLSGEAEFSVVHTDTDQRFIVKTPKDFQVEVLGTEFSVFTRTRGTKVVLNSGKIRIDYRKEGKPAQLTMRPGDLLKMDESGDIRMETTKTPEEHSAWKERRFVFDGTPVSEICQLLEENFGVIVRPSNGEIGERSITGNFETQTHEELLDILREVFALETRKQKDTLMLYQKQEPTIFN
ncbi:MAG: hypothetical protein ABS46_06210 [Cytophagaceae bacterium SCN 52-12]|nr:MAG: hypothetical protein ABS46_06210 [Cytophagaceae bacterium SCN 52-12]